ncbi:MAG: AAA family ATPase [Clostridia bacterium]|nr:AAA family ATPase [Clostridia bacterium]
MFYNLCADNVFLSSQAILIYIILFFVVLVILIVSVVANDRSAKPDGASSQPSQANTVQITAAEVKGAEKPKAKQGEEEEEESGIRFPQLCAIDKDKFRYKKSDYDEKITLKEFCDQFRDYAAGELKLYYDIKDIRQFVAGMAVSKIIILQGMSGTGKTSLATAFGEFVDNLSTVVSVQPMWKERTDLIGYFNEFTKKFSEQSLLIKMYEANYSKDIYITVLDEMNIARVEYYFAEFLSLLELPNKEQRYLKVVTKKWKNDPKQLNKEGKIRIPDNMWYVGTANNDDSTFAISDKVYDRAMIMDLDRKAEPFRAGKVKKVHITSDRFYRLANEAKKEYRITGRNRRRLGELDKYMIEKYHITFGNRIKKQIEEYIPVYVGCGGKEIDALDEILSKKVMRKLSMQNPILVRNTSEDFIRYIDDLFGEENMQLCKDSIRRIANNA